MGTFAWRRRQTRHFGEQWVPFAELSLQAIGGRWRAFSVQIDTGAVISVLARSAADLLGIVLDTGERVELSGVGGTSHVYFVHRLQARIGELESFGLRVAIADREDVPNLLGRLDVLDVLQIDLDVSLLETRFSAPWLDDGGRRMFRGLNDIEKTILAEWSTNPLPGQIDEALRRLLTRANMLLGAAAGLVKLHRSYDLPLLVRSLFEISVQFEYMMLDAETRAGLYLDYEHITKHRSAQAWASLPGLVGDEIRNSPMRPLGEAVNQVAYDRVLPRYASQTRPDKPRSHWYPGNLRQLAVEIGSERSAEYDAIYGLYSAWAHGDPWTADHVRPVREELWHPFFYWARLLKGIADAKKIILSGDAYKSLEELAKGLSRA